IVEFVNGRIILTCYRARCGRIDTAAPPVDPGFRQAEREDQHVHLLEEVFYFRKMVPAQRERLLDGVEAFRLDIRAERVEESSVPGPDTRGIARAGFGVAGELKELPHRVDVAVARGIDPVTEALRGLVGKRFRRRLDIHDGEAAVPQETRDMLRKA